MRYSLADFLACPGCSGSLAVVVIRETAAEVPRIIFRESNRVPPPDAIVAPLPGVPVATDVGRLLLRHAASHAAPSRNFEVEVEEGLLVCVGCGNWFPIRRLLPELLPDHLRDWPADDAWLAQAKRALPPDLAAAVGSRPRDAGIAADAGAHHKRAEIRIKEKIEDPTFFGPGYSSPFNPHDTGHTLYLLKLFGAAMPLLDLQQGDLLLDSGCGYGWTTEWFFKSGVEAIGVDICRTYLDIGVERIGAWRPHFVVADIEHLPIRDSILDAVFAYESFHHIPDRSRAMADYARALKQEGRIVLAEPGGAHEEAQVSVDAMAKYGILEKGMELDDVRAYAAGLPLDVQQVHLVRVASRELGIRLDGARARIHSAVEANLFRLEKRPGLVAQATAAVREPRRLVWPRLKRRVKRALARVGLD